MYLSQVILCVEEVCVLGLISHCFDVVLGLVDDGQVEQPVDTEGEGRKTVKRHIHNSTKHERQTYGYI